LMRSVVNMVRFHPGKDENHGWTRMNTDKNNWTLTS
jgi:hypothetical protein